MALNLDKAAEEMRGSKMIEALEKLFKRMETRVDGQRLLKSLSADGQAYAQHLVMSGPSANVSAEEALKFTPERLEAAMAELEKALFKKK